METGAWGVSGGRKGQYGPVGKEKKNEERGTGNSRGFFKTGRE